MYAVIVSDMVDSLHEEDGEGRITVPDFIQVGAVLVGDRFVNPQPTTPVTAPIASPAVTSLSPVEFKMLFTVQERLVIKAARATDAVVEDIFSLLDDPRLTAVRLNIKGTRDSVTYLAQAGLISAGRVDQILSGVPSE
jgi:hypothetical protein